MRLPKTALPFDVRKAFGLPEISQKDPGLRPVRAQPYIENSADGSAERFRTSDGEAAPPLMTLQQQPSPPRYSGLRWLSGSSQTPSPTVPCRPAQGKRRAGVP